MEKKILKVYGIRPVLELLDSGKEIQKIFIQKNIRNNNILKIMNEAKKKNIEIKSVPEFKLNKLTKKKHQGVFAISSPISFVIFEDYLHSIYEHGKIPIFILLDRITDVRNFGSICRTCEAFGVHGIIIPSKENAPINEISIKASAGALTKIPICKSKNLIKSLNFARESGLQICSMSEKSNTSFFDIKLTKPVIIVMGSEKNGISKNILEISDFTVKIPLIGETESLNVSVASGIALAELTRQRLKYNFS